MSRVIVLDDTLNLAASSSVVIYLLDISSVRIFLTLNAPLPEVTSGVTSGVTLGVIFFLQIITWPSSSSTPQSGTLPEPTNQLPAVHQKGNAHLYLLLIYSLVCFWVLSFGALITHHISNYPLFLLLTVSCLQVLVAGYGCQVCILQFLSVLWFCRVSSVQIRCSFVCVATYFVNNGFVVAPRNAKQRALHFAPSRGHMTTRGWGCPFGCSFLLVQIFVSLGEGSQALAEDGWWLEAEVALKCTLVKALVECS